MSVHQNIGFFQKNYRNSKIRDLEIFRAFRLAKAAMVTYIGVSDKFLRESGYAPILPEDMVSASHCQLRKRRLGQTVNLLAKAER